MQHMYLNASIPNLNHHPSPLLIKQPIIYHLNNYNHPIYGFIDSLSINHPQPKMMSYLILNFFLYLNKYLFIYFYLYQQNYFLK